MQIWYSVTATFVAPDVRDDYLAWLSGGHMQAVVSCGALDARAVVVDGDDMRVQTQYVFPSQMAFDQYVEIHAPALRTDGQKRFPAERGVTFARQLGKIAASFTGCPQSNNP